MKLILLNIFFFTFISFNILAQESREISPQFSYISSTALIISALRDVVMPVSSGCGQNNKRSDEVLSRYFQAIENHDQRRFKEKHENLRKHYEENVAKINLKEKEIIKEVYKNRTLKFLPLLTPSEFMQMTYFTKKVGELYLANEEKYTEDLNEHKHELKKIQQNHQKHQKVIEFVSSIHDSWNQTSDFKSLTAII